MGKLTLFVASLVLFCCGQAPQPSDPGKVQQVTNATAQQEPRKTQATAPKDLEFPCTCILWEYEPGTTSSIYYAEFNASDCNDPQPRFIEHSPGIAAQACDACEPGELTLLKNDPKSGKAGSALVSSHAGLKDKKDKKFKLQDTQKTKVSKEFEKVVKFTVTDAATGIEVETFATLFLVEAVDGGPLYRVFGVGYEIDNSTSPVTPHIVLSPADSKKKVKPVKLSTGSLPQQCDLDLGIKFRVLTKTQLKF